MTVEYGVIQVDKTGYRVAGSIEVFDEKGAASSILELARGALALARSLRKPVASVTLSWPDGYGVVSVKNGEVVAVIIEESRRGAVPAASGLTTATAES